jgi:hypothetical protein
MEIFWVSRRQRLQLRAYAPLFALEAGDADNPLQRAHKRLDEQTLALIVGPIPYLDRKAGAAHLVMVARTRHTASPLRSSAHRHVHF